MSFNALKTRMIRRISACVAAALAVSTIALDAQTSQRLTAGRSNEYGLIYSLPVTVADIYLEAELTEETPGEFHNYARRYLSMADAITERSNTATLTRAIIVPRGVASTDSRWLAQFKSGSTPYMLVTPESVPLSLNTERTYAREAIQLPQPTQWTTSPLDGPAASQAITAEMARSSSTSKRAELAAQRIFELREMRSDILSGQADNMPSDGEAMRLVLDNISAQEAALTAMFTGVRRTRTVTTCVTVVPDSADISGRVIARLSAVNGLLEADDLAGAPITANIKVLERGQMPANDKGEPKTFPRGGVAYCIPGTSEITVISAGSTVAVKNIAVAQTGVVFGLNPTMFTDKREPAMAIFDPTCGAVIELGPAQ